jgi:ERCC4-related helicase
MNDTQNSFITNKDKFLSEIINGILPKSNAVDILVGYFYFSGYNLISEKLKDKKVCILVGLDVDINIMKCIHEIDSLENNNLSRGQIRENYFSHFVKLFNETDFLDSEEKLHSFDMFYNKILDGTLEIRKTEDPCHAKMYIFEYNDEVNENGEQPGTVITGSSNLSYAGLEGRIEINARFSDKNYVIDGQKIFNELWDKSIIIADKDNIEDFDIKVIDKIWYNKLYSPYLMYLRVLKEYFEIPTKDNTLTPYDITNGKFANLKYQTDAVQMAINAIETHNGVIIADVVGLGKSIIASTVARNMKLHSIIICPPHLVKQWEEYKDDFTFTATVFSSGMIESALNFYRKQVRECEQYLIIVDEAHRYRNEYTQDYAYLHDLCSNNKVMLLTATPFNNRPDDIYSMLKLFQIPTNSTLKTVDNLGASFKELINKYKQLAEDQRNGKATEEDVKREVDVISKEIRSIISPLVVRRSRIDLQEIPEYAEDLKQQKIQVVLPEDPIELNYDLTDLRSLYLKTLSEISPSKEEKKKNENNSEFRYFKAARYSPVTYITEDKKLREKMVSELEEKTGIKFNLLLGRQMNISEFMRKMLVRRFESSIEAFRKSLDYMIQSSENILKWIEKSNKVPVYKKGNLPSVDDFYKSEDDGTVEIQETFDKYEKRGFFEIDMKYINDKFVTDIEADVNLLKEIRNEWFGNDTVIKSDPKLDSFKQILRDKLSKEPKRKLVVFTEFADTANYLGSQLVADGLPVFKYTSADASVGNKDIIDSNFNAGLKESMQKDDYKILVATDAISEGYNLHRAGAIFNYDIPYNPTRVIQRIGRINRINKKVFNKLYIYNYFPSDVGETETRTKEISTLKMAMIHAIMGEDTKALTKDEEVQAYFKERYNKELAKDEEASWDNKYHKLLNQLKGTSEYLEALNIPHRARTGRNVPKPLTGVLMFGKKGHDYVFKIGNSEETPLSLTAEEALSLFEAQQSEGAVALSESFDSIYQNVKARLFTNDVQDKKEKERLNALNKVKAILAQKTVNVDYLKDLITVINSDALSGYENRFINQLKPKDYSKLPEVIAQDYLGRIITTKNKVSEGEESVILTEEIQK